MCPASFLEGVTVPLPPLPEQHRIVEAIEYYLTRLDDAIATLERVHRNLKRYRASVLKAAVEGRLVPTETELARQDNRDYEPASVLLEHILKERKRRFIENAAEKGRAKAEEKAKDSRNTWSEVDNERALTAERDKATKKYKEPATPDTADLPELPEGWCWVAVGAIADQRLGKMLDKAKNVGRLRPYLRNLSTRWFGFDLSDPPEMRVTDEEYSDVSVRYGDLVICEGGEPGRCAVWTDENATIAIQKALHRVRPEPGVFSHYLSFVLGADALTGRLESAFTGSGIKHFTGQSLRKYAIPVPPTNEQQRIVEEIQNSL